MTRVFSHSIKKQWKLSVFVLVFLPLLLRLGVWQLERAEEKQALLTVYQQQQQLPAIPFADIKIKGGVSYQKVIVEGRYNPTKYWLLDNRSRNGRVGYEVVMPFVTQNSMIFVNRGWVQAPARRELLPDITTPTDTIVLKGYFHRPSENAVVKHNISDLALEWPKRVLQLDPISMHKNLADDNKVLASNTVLRLDENTLSALLTEWPIINTRPEKHQAYAVQWFAMALTLFLLYVWCLTRKKTEI